MWIEYFRIAGKVLVAHKYRSLLTVLSITVGTFSIVLMSSLATSGLATLAADVEELGGGRLLYVGPKSAEREEAKLASYSKGFTKADRDALIARLPHLAEHTMFSALNDKELVADTGRIVQTDLVGVDGDFFSALHMVPTRGHFFTEEDNQRHAKSCVVGAKLAHDVWDGDAVGHTMSIGGIRCRIIAQVDAKEYFGMNYGFDWVNFAAVPFETVLEVDPAIKTGLTFEMKVDSIENSEPVKRIMNAVLLSRHNGQDDFEILDFSSVMKKNEKTTQKMLVMVGLIAGVALLVGGIGVMNMMLVSVSERVREIGIRKALGATPTDIGSQFLLEAMVLAGTGGFIGVTSGIGVVEACNMLIHHFMPTWINVISQGSVLAGLGVSLGVGIGFGYFPARQAARLDPILAIRRS